MDNNNARPNQTLYMQPLLADIAEHEILQGTASLQLPQNVGGSQINAIINHTQPQNSLYGGFPDTLQRYIPMVKTSKSSMKATINSEGPSLRYPPNLHTNSRKFVLLKQGTGSSSSSPTSKGLKTIGQPNEAPLMRSTLGIDTVLRGEAIGSKTGSLANKDNQDSSSFKVQIPQAKRERFDATAMYSSRSPRDESPFGTGIRNLGGTTSNKQVGTDMESNHDLAVVIRPEESHILNIVETHGSTDKSPLEPGKKSIKDQLPPLALNKSERNITIGKKPLPQMDWSETHQSFFDHVYNTTGQQRSLYKPLPHSTERSGYASNRSFEHTQRILQSTVNLTAPFLKQQACRSQVEFQGGKKHSVKSIASMMKAANSRNAPLPSDMRRGYHSQANLLGSRTKSTMKKLEGDDSYWLKNIKKNEMYTLKKLKQVSPISKEKVFARKFSRHNLLGQSMNNSQGGTTTDVSNRNHFTQTMNTAHSNVAATQRQKQAFLQSQRKTIQGEGGGIGYLTEYCNFNQIYEMAEKAKTKETLLKRHQIGTTSAGDLLSRPFTHGKDSVASEKFQNSASNGSPDSQVNETSRSVLSKANVTIKWLEKSRDQRLRRAELNKILSKRSKVSEKMDETLKQQSLANKLINSTFSIERDDSITQVSHPNLPTGLNDLNISVAKAGAQVILHELSKEKSSRDDDLTKNTVIDIQNVEDTNPYDPEESQMDKMTQLMTQELNKQIYLDNIQAIDDSNTALSRGAQAGDFQHLTTNGMKNYMTSSFYKDKLEKSHRNHVDGSRLYSLQQLKARGMDSRKRFIKQVQEQEDLIKVIHDEGIEKIVDEMEQVKEPESPDKSINKLSISAPPDRSASGKKSVLRSSIGGSSKAPPSLLEQKKQKMEEEKLEEEKRLQDEALEKEVQIYINQLREKVRTGTLENKYERIFDEFDRQHRTPSPTSTTDSAMRLEDDLPAKKGSQAQKILGLIRKPLFDQVKQRQTKQSRLLSNFESISNDTILKGKRSSKTSLNLQMQANQLTEITSEGSTKGVRPLDQALLLAGKDKLKAMQADGSFKHYLVRMKEGQLRVNKDRSLQRKIKGTGGGFHTISASEGGKKMPMASRLQNLVHSKKFDFIRHNIKQFERIRRKSERTFQILVSKSQSKKPGDLERLSSTTSDEVYEISIEKTIEEESDENISQLPTPDEQPKLRRSSDDKRRSSIRLPMTSSQIIAQKNLNVDPLEQRSKFKKLLLSNSDLRQFMNDHEVLVQGTFDQLVTDLQGIQKKKKDGVSSKLSLRDGKKQSARKRNHAEQQVRSSQNVQELYINWLFRLYGLNPHFSKPKVEGDDMEAVLTPEGQDLGAFSFKELPLTYNSTRFLSKQAYLQQMKQAELIVNKQQRQKKIQEIKEQELMKAFLFKRLGIMADKSGRLEKIRKMHIVPESSRRKSFTTASRRTEKPEKREVSFMEGNSHKSGMHVDIFSLPPEKKPTKIPKKKGIWARESDKTPEMGDPDSRANVKKMADHYGKWYLDPTDFGKSLQNVRNKLLKELIVKQEVKEELKMMENSQMCLSKGHN